MKDESNVIIYSDDFSFTRENDLCNHTKCRVNGGHKLFEGLFLVNDMQTRPLKKSRFHFLVQMTHNALKQMKNQFSDC